jgi:hypothetical protein
MSKAASDAFNRGEFNITIKKDKLDFNCSGNINYTISGKNISSGIPGIPSGGASGVPILGCLLTLETFPAKCGQCNSYSALSKDGTSCDCAFRYNITVQNNDTLVIKHFLNISQQYMSPNQSDIDCSTVLNYTFKNQSIEQNLTQDLS